MNVARITPHVVAIQAPDEIRSLPGWVVWRHEGGGEGVKPRKVPYYAAGGRRHGMQGRPEDRAQLVTFDAACAAAARRGFDGVGLCLLAEFGVTVLDFDNAVTGQGLRPELLAMLGDTYVEFSPSGAGVHAIYKGSLGDRKSHADADRFGVEAFSSKGFVTFTGNALPHVADLELAGIAVAPINDDVRALCAARFGRQADVDDDDFLLSCSPPIGLTETQILDALAVLDPAMGHDDWLRIGMAIHHETGGERFDIWDDWSSLAEAEYPGREELSKRWESFGKAGGAKVTAATLLKMAKANGADINPRAVVTAEDFGAPGATGSPKSARFAPLSLVDLLQRPRSLWTIKRVLPQSGVGMVYGPSMSGKSFFVMDLCMAVARGVEWRSRRVKQGAVAYIAAEGMGGFPDRVRAYRDFHGVDLEGVPLHVIPAAPNLLEREQVKELVGELMTLPGLRVVVVDTLAQTTAGGDENASRDIGTALAHCKAISEATGALVLLVGHTGKDEEKGPRGHSSQIAAFDVAIRLERDGDLREATIAKLKDGQGEGDAYPFHLGSVVIGQDEDGEEITSCVVLPGLANGAQPAAPKLAPLQRRIYDTAVTLLDLGGLLQKEALIAEVVASLAKPPGEDNRRRDVKRELPKLVKLGMLLEAAGVIALPEHESAKDSE